MTTIDIDITDPATGYPWDVDELREEALHLLQSGFNRAAQRILALADALGGAA